VVRSFQNYGYPDVYADSSFGHFARDQGGSG